MMAALENLSLIESSQKTLFLGDMFELGETANEEHQSIAEYAQKLGFKDVYLVGENFFKVNTTFQKFKTFENLKSYLVDANLPKSTILIKGSRGMALERILELL